MKLGKGQQKIIIAIAIVLVAGWGFVQFIYLPQRGRLKQLRRELTAITTKLEDAQAKIEVAGSPVHGIGAMKEELALLEKRLSTKEQISSVLKQLSEQAERFEINVLSINPQGPTPCLDSKGAPIVVEEFACERRSIKINMECRYQALGEYLRSLRGELEALVTVDGLKIDKDKDISPFLKVELIVTIYSLSSKEALEGQN